MSVCFMLRAYMPCMCIACELIVFKSPLQHDSVVLSLCYSFSAISENTYTHTLCCACIFNTQCAHHSANDPHLPLALTKLQSKPSLQVVWSDTSTCVASQTQTHYAHTHTHRHFSLECRIFSVKFEYQRELSTFMTTVLRVLSHLSLVFGL